MNISNRTVLITGGGSGIGLAVAQSLSEKGNKVIITGRTEEKLAAAVKSLNNASYIVCDVTKEDDVTALVTNIKENYSDLSILINNAGSAFVYTHGENADALRNAQQEMTTNYFSVIRITQQLIGVLKSQPDAAIVNVTSILAFSPMAILPTYSDSKAALHSYSLSLRHTLAKDTAIKVFELMPPLVNTDFSKDIGGEANGIPPGEVAQGLINGIENDTPEIYIGQTAGFRDYFLSSPVDAFKMLNN